jgi:tetratricopeptide (TPR) repeat protein
VAEGEEAKAAAEGAEEMKGARQRLATFLGISDPNELERLGDPKTFPNYAYLVEYYSGSIQVAQRRGLKGIEALIGTQQTTNLQSAVKRGLRLVRRNRKNPQAWSALGSAYFGLGRHEDALLAFTYALSFEDKPVEAYYNRSVVHIILGNYEQAIRDCTDALRIDPRRAEAYNNRGMAYVRKGNPDLALTDLNKALELEIRYKEAYLNRGAVYNELGKFELASDDFERAYLLGYTGAGLWLNWGTALIQLHNYASALEKLSQAVLYEMEADVARAYAQRGFAYLQLGEAYYLSARADLEKAIQLDDRLLEAHSNLGLLEARQNRYEAAIDHYKKALEVNRDHIRTRYNLAVAYVKLSRLEEAKTEFQSIINSAPGTFEAQQSQDYLSSL